MGITIAIDGPAGAGKSTVAQRVAAALGYQLVDTGAIYRAVALLAQRNGIAFTDDPALEGLIAGMALRFEFHAGHNHCLVGDDDISAAIRTPEISRAASDLSTNPAVRRALLQLQRDLAGGGGAVLEGRDIGTVVCPEAEVKVFLNASLAERARRRAAELQAQGRTVAFADVLTEVEARDTQDSGRTHAPLCAAPDAVRLDCTTLAIDEVVERILALV
jgi:cytidylate kinase